jgi:hypothetical protein
MIAAPQGRRCCSVPNVRRWKFDRWLWRRIPDVPLGRTLPEAGVRRRDPGRGHMEFFSGPSSLATTTTTTTSHHPSLWLCHPSLPWCPRSSQIQYNSSLVRRDGGSCRTFAVVTMTNTSMDHPPDVRDAGGVSYCVKFPAEGLDLPQHRADPQNREPRPRLRPVRSVSAFVIVDVRCLGMPFWSRGSPILTSVGGCCGRILRQSLFSRDEQTATTTSLMKRASVRPPRACFDGLGLSSKCKGNDRPGSWRSLC